MIKISFLPGYSFLKVGQSFSCTHRRSISKARPKSRCRPKPTPQVISSTPAIRFQPHNRHTWTPRSKSLHSTRNRSNTNYTYRVRSNSGPRSRKRAPTPCDLHRPSRSNPHHVHIIYRQHQPCFRAALPCIQVFQAYCHLTTLKMTGLILRLYPQVVCYFPHETLVHASGKYVFST